MDSSVEETPRLFLRNGRFRPFGLAQLPIIVNKDGGFVLLAPGSAGGVVAAPEYSQQLIIGNHRRIVIDL